jgi:hypothetical protein
MKIFFRLISNLLDAVSEFADKISFWLYIKSL